MQIDPRGGLLIWEGGGVCFSLGLGFRGGGEGDILQAPFLEAVISGERPAKSSV